MGFGNYGKIRAIIGVLPDECPGAEIKPVNLIRIIPAEERYDAVAVCPYGHRDRGDENRRGG